MMSSVSLKFTPGLRSTSARSGTAASSSVRTSFKDPLTARPIGVRMASTITASGISAPRLTDQSIVPIPGSADAHGGGGERAARRELLLGLGAARALRQQPGREGVAGARGVDD